MSKMNTKAVVAGLIMGLTMATAQAAPNPGPTPSPVPTIVHGATITVTSALPSLCSLFQNTLCGVVEPKEKVPAH